MISEKVTNSTIDGTFYDAIKIKQFSGDVAQLGERGVRNAEVEGSNPFISTK
jgi:hypothetical protein